MAEQPPSPPPPIAHAPTPNSWVRVRPAQVSIELAQHGVEGRAAVVGETVRLGERLTGAGGGSVIAPVDGAIVASPAGRIAIGTSAEYAIVAEPPHHDHLALETIVARLGAIKPTERGQWIDRIRAAGIVVDRHGCPNLFEQLRQSMTRPTDTVVCCALDADPSLPFASTLLEQFAAELCVGLALVGRISGAARAIVVADEDQRSIALAPARHWAGATGSRVDRIANPYPQADPTLLLYTLLARRLRPGRSPTEVGVILLDAPAAIAIGALVMADRPMTDVFIAARDVMSRQVRRAYVPVGTDLATALLAMGFNATASTLRAGAMLRDERVGGDLPIGFGELTFHVAPPEPVLNPDPCVRCGWCVEICPPRIHPAALLDAAQRGNVPMGEHHGLHTCIECGLCTYVCPSKLPLLRAIRSLKSLATESDEAAS